MQANFQTASKYDFSNNHDLKNKRQDDDDLNDLISQMLINNNDYEFN